MINNYKEFGIYTYENDVYIFIYRNNKEHIIGFKIKNHTNLSNKSINKLLFYSHFQLNFDNVFWFNNSSSPFEKELAYLGQIEKKALQLLLKKKMDELIEENNLSFKKK